VAERRARPRRSAAASVTDPAVLAGLVAVLLSPVVALPPALARPVTSLAPATPPSLDGNLTIDPASFWMRTDSNVSLRGIWSTESPLCVASALWFDWSVTNGTATGFLNSTRGPVVTFDAASFASGFVVLLLRASASIECGVDQTVVERAASANLSIVSPLSVSGVSLDPLILTPGANATLSGTVSGGAPPYVLQVSWGDGFVTTLPLPDPGPFSLNHSFSAGAFAPVVRASDSEGAFVNASVPEATSVGTGLRAAVVPRDLVAEVGMPMQFQGEVVDPPPAAVTLFNCSDTSGVASAPSHESSNETSASF